MNKKESPIPIVPKRAPNYGCHPVNGFGVAYGGDGQVILEPFFDLPPLPSNFSDSVSELCMKRQIWGTYMFSQEQAKTLIEMLKQALEAAPKNNEKNN